MLLLCIQTKKKEEKMYLINYFCKNKLQLKLNCACKQKVTFYVIFK